ncbi:MAG: hypothetical protein GX640_04825, partial [Fibrobacter sp.]|nr:hypothetical protein [Fibrobacter sp.]
TITVETGSLRVEASGKTSAGMFDKITLSSNVFSTKKVVSLGWDIGNTGSFTFTSDGRISFGPVKSPGKIMCIVRAIDETGEQDFDTLSVIVGLKWDSRQLPASYPNHKGQTLLTFNNRLWLIGGSVNDVWNSMDAQSWNLVTETAPFGKRYGHGSLVFQNRIWVIGGKIGHDSLPGDIYSSIDGKIWNREISASFLKRYYHSLVVSNDELFLISGINDSPEKPCLNDIWSTKDGLHWNLIAESAEFGPRYGHGSTLFRNSIIVAGGFYDGIDGSKIYTDMWSSKNGITWVKESDNIGFQNNQFLTLLNYDNKLWAFGGFYEGNNNTPGFSEITLSEDGISWTKISGQSPKTESYFLSGVIFNNKITLSPSGNRSILIMK